MSDKHSVTVWLPRLEQGDPQAAAEIWRRYYNGLVHLARRHLGNAPRRAADEDDVAAEAFEAFIQGVQHGCYPALKDRDGLWRLLAAITACKAKNQIRRECAGKRDARETVGEQALQDLPDPKSPPELEVELAEQYERLLDLLGDKELQRIAQLKCEGLTNQEIADQIGRAAPTVERRLRLIRTYWRQELIPC